MNTGREKNNPTASPRTITSCGGENGKAGTAIGMSSMPTTGTIQAGVAWVRCCVVVVQRSTIHHANSTMPIAPTHQIASAVLGKTGASTSGKSKRLMKTVPKRLPATGCANSARTASGANDHLTK